MSTPPTLLMRYGTPFYDLLTEVYLSHRLAECFDHRSFKYVIYLDRTVQHDFKSWVDCYNIWSIKW